MPYQLGELPTVTLIVLSALFAMLNGIGGHPTVYVHSYSGLTFPPWLTNNTIKVSSHFFPKALDWVVTLSIRFSMTVARHAHRNSLFTRLPYNRDSAASSYDFLFCRVVIASQFAPNHFDIRTAVILHLTVSRILAVGIGFEPIYFWLTVRPASPRTVAHNNSGDTYGIRTRDLCRDRAAH